MEPDNKDALLNAIVTQPQAGQLLAAVKLRLPYDRESSVVLVDLSVLPLPLAAALRSAPSSCSTTSTSAAVGLFSKLSAMARAVRNRSYTAMAAIMSGSAVCRRCSTVIRASNLSVPSSVDIAPPVVSRHRKASSSAATIKTLAACALFAWAAAASAQDRWLGDDKPKHVAMSALSALVVESMFAKTLTPVERFGLAMVPGIVKELADARRGGSGISGKDIAADALGVLGGMAFHGLVIRPNYIGLSLKF